MSFDSNSWLCFIETEHPLKKGDNCPMGAIHTLLLFTDWTAGAHESKCCRTERKQGGMFDHNVVIRISS